MGRPGERSLHDRAREGGGKKRVQRDIEASSTGEIMGAIGDKSEGKEKRNEQSKTGEEKVGRGDKLRVTKRNVS